MTTDDFKKKANIKHKNFYSYEKSEYTLSKEKIKITCPLHGGFEQIARNHLSGAGCKKCADIKTTNSTRMSKEVFFKRCRVIHNNKYNYTDSEFLGTNHKIQIKCPTHGHFEKVAGNHLAGQGCSKCLASFKERSEIVHGKRYNYELTDYKNINEKVKIICPVHGIFEQSPKCHLRGNGCQICGFEKRTSKLAVDKDFFVEKAVMVHGNKYSYDLTTYKNTKSKVTIVCPDHGNFEQQPASHLSGAGCPKCAKRFNLSELKLFNAIKRKFPDLNIISQGKPVWLGAQAFDIYIPELNIAIEYQGRQHFIPVSLFGGKEGFEKTQQRDLLKKNLCGENDIKLIYFSYDPSYIPEDIKDLVCSSEETLFSLIAAPTATTSAA